MKNKTGRTVFQWSGLAALSDLHTLEYKEHFRQLEKEQDTFLAKEAFFRSEEYNWPRDSLRNFSRVWEYPYVYRHLADYFIGLPKKRQPIVADLGSGVTFFPFSIAHTGCKVICLDIDPICARDLPQACKYISPSPGSIEFRLITSDKLPCADQECHIVYCISVLEHIPNFEKTIEEIARILEPGGLCLMTCDINLRPSDERQLNNVEYIKLRSTIDKAFDLVHPERTIHPANMLTTKNSPYPLKIPSRSMTQTGFDLIKQRVVKPLLGRKPGRVRKTVPEVAVLGLVLKKKA